MSVRVHARIDGVPQWDQAPTNSPGGLYEFESGKLPNRLDLEGDTLELRVYFPYYKNAYPGPAWKSKCVLRSLHAQYRQPLRVRQNR
jgi:hypothetical protein